MTNWAIGICNLIRPSNFVLRISLSSPGGGRTHNTRGLNPRPLPVGIPSHLKFEERNSEFEFRTSRFSVSAPGWSRTSKSVKRRRGLNPLRFPFRHGGKLCGAKVDSSRSLFRSRLRTRPGDSFQGGARGLGGWRRSPQLI